MPIIPAIGRRSPRLFSFILVLYLLLIIGAVTMAYPILMTLTASVSNEWDHERFSVMPQYLFDRRELYAKFLAEKYVERGFSIFAAGYNAPSHWNSFRSLREDPKLFTDYLTLFGSEKTRSKELEKISADYREWMKVYTPSNTIPLFDRFTKLKYQEFLRGKYKAALKVHPAASVNAEKKALTLLVETWNEGRFTAFEYINMDVETKYPYHLSQWFPPVEQKRYQDYLTFLPDLSATMKIPITGQYLWSAYLETTVLDFAEFKKKSGLKAESFYQVQLPTDVPENPYLASLYTDFLQQKWPLRLVRLSESVKPGYISYLKNRFGKIEMLNRLAAKDYAGWEDVPFYENFPVSPYERIIWRDFVTNELPISGRVMEFPEGSYREFLRQKYDTLESLNRSYGWTVKSFDDVAIPIPEIDYAQFLKESGYWFRQFLSFNFQTVFGQMAVQGRALMNTAIYVVLSVLGSLIFNPLAAYALARFKLRQSQSILLFCLATMMFPAEIVMIPNFLLLREMHLLNTFGALLLPGLVAGFSIFLLKGFFQSIPEELYESASIDGASELTIFLRVTLPLSKPILAYIGLMSFIGAYGSFMWPFLTNQDPKMWVLTVWLYQFQQIFSNYPYMVMAAFVLTSIPTFIVFIFCQNIILRGIVIPTMK